MSIMAFPRCASLALVTVANAIFSEVERPVVRRVEVDPSGVLTEVDEQLLGTLGDSGRADFVELPPWPKDQRREDLRLKVMDRAKNGLILVGTSETRRIFGVVVSLLANFTPQEYREYQQKSRKAESGACDNMCSGLTLPGFTCNPKMPGLHYISPEANVFFLWQRFFTIDACPDRLSVPDALNDVGKQFHNPTVYLSAPLSHSLFNPSFATNFFASKEATIDGLTRSLTGSFEQLLDAFMTATKPWLKRNLVVGLGSAYCSSGEEDLLERVSPPTSGGLVKLQNGSLRSLTTSATKCFSDKLSMLSQRLERLESPCDYFLQANEGMKHANDIVRRVISNRSGIVLADMYSTGVGRTKEILEYVPDECLRTHWPFPVIMDQLQAIISATS